MTPEQDQRNAEINELMRSCQHRVLWTPGNGVECSLCGARFMLLLLPRIRPVYPVPDEVESEL